VLSAAELTSLRSTLTASLPGTVSVTRATLASDGMGGSTETWAAVVGAAARVSPSISGEDRIVGGKDVSEAPWTVTLPQGTNVTVRDRITTPTMTLEVVATSGARSFDTCVRCACVEVR
jgi:head-tail adaptor